MSKTLHSGPELGKLEECDGQFEGSDEIGNLM